MRQFFALFLLACLFAGTASAPVFAQNKNTEENTYDEKSVVEAGADYLGIGASKMAEALESIFKDHGRPNAYIAGEEVGGGLVVGLRYGAGNLTHKIEGQSKIHWTGPSIGLDAGADAVKTFSLVYNLYDVEEIYKRFPALEGSVFYVAGLGISVHQRDDMVVATTRLGVGLRAQASVGYIRFSKKKRLLPF